MRKCNKHTIQLYLMISKYEYLVGISSLWLLLPGELCLIQYHTIPRYIGIGSLSIVTSVVSTVTWYNKSKNLYWYLDHILANSLFVSLNGYYIITKKQTHTPGGFLPFSVSIFAIYNAGYITSHYKYKNTTLFLHLLFRYIGFWFTYITIVDLPSFKIFTGITSGYVAHLLLELKHKSGIEGCDREDNIEQRDYVYGALCLLIPVQCLVVGGWLCECI